MKKKDLLLDVDEVICFSGYLDVVNAFLNTNYNIDDFKDYYIDEVAIPKDRMDEFNAFLNNWNLYENPTFLPNSIETIKKLNEKYNIYICSACVNSQDYALSGKIFKDKFEFLLKILPFINPENIILTSAKHLFKADIQIDDRVSNLENDIKLKILFPSYHNTEVTPEELKEKGIIKAGNDWRKGWKEVEKILLDYDNE